MGLESLIKKQVSNAIKTIGDLAPTITYVVVVPGAYDPITDTQNNTETSYPVNSPLVAPTDKEIAGMPADKVTQKLLIAALDLPGVAPNADHYVIVDGSKWSIVKVEGVPGKSLWKILVQEP